MISMIVLTKSKECFVFGRTKSEKRFSFGRIEMNKRGRNHSFFLFWSVRVS